MIMQKMGGVKAEGKLHR
jgi:hypothetical protein